MNTDYYFERGKSHDLCEDYAWAGLVGDSACALLSDGCSSQPHTDFGARILVHAAIDRLQKANEDFRLEGFACKTIENAARMAGCLDSFPITSLDATLLLARVSPKSSPAMFSAQIFVWGDGLLAVKKGSQIQATLIRYTGNAPHYLAYHLDPQRERNYQQQRFEREIVQVTLSRAGDNSQERPFSHCIPKPLEQGGTGLAFKSDLPPHPVPWGEGDTESGGGTKGGAASPEDPFAEKNQSLHTSVVTGAAESVGSPLTPFHASFELGSGDALALVSDGITQFFGGAGTQLSWESLAPEFVSFKQSAGVFLKRRMNFFQRKNREHGITHADDLAVAAITL